MKYRVLDLRTDPPAESIVDAVSPEKAVADALEIDAVRSGARGQLVARVYWQVEGTPMNMVRLYERLAER